MYRAAARLSLAKAAVSREHVGRDAAMRSAARVASQPGLQMIQSKRELRIGRMEAKTELAVDAEKRKQARHAAHTPGISIAACGTLMDDVQTGHALQQFH